MIREIAYYIQYVISSLSPDALAFAIAINVDVIPFIW